MSGKQKSMRKRLKRLFSISDGSVFVNSRMTQSQDYTNDKTPEIPERMTQSYGNVLEMAEEEPATNSCTESVLLVSLISGMLRSGCVGESYK